MMQKDNDNYMVILEKVANVFLSNNEGSLSSVIAMGFGKNYI